MHDFQGYFSRTFQVLEFSRKNPGLFRRRGNPEIAAFVGWGCGATK